MSTVVISGIDLGLFSCFKRPRGILLSTTEEESPEATAAFDRNVGNNTIPQRKIAVRVAIPIFIVYKNPFKNNVSKQVTTVREWIHETTNPTAERMPSCSPTPRLCFCGTYLHLWIFPSLNRRNFGFAIGFSMTMTRR